MTGKHKRLLAASAVIVLAVFALGLVVTFSSSVTFAQPDPSEQPSETPPPPDWSPAPPATSPGRGDIDIPPTLDSSSAPSGGSSISGGGTEPGDLDLGIKIWPLGGLVPCGNPDQPACNECYIIVLVINLLNFMILTIAPALALLAFLYAGFVYAFSGGSDSRITAAKTVLWNVVIGSLIVFGAYFIVDTVIKVVTSNASGQSFSVANLGPWNAPTFVQNYLGTGSCSIFGGKPLERGPSGSLQKSTQQATSAIEKAANIAGGIILGLSVLMILYSAFLFTTNGGDSDRLTAARRALLFALVGVGIALLAFVIPNLVLKVFS